MHCSFSSPFLQTLEAFFFFFKSIQNGETYVRSNLCNMSQTCQHLSTSRWSAGLIGVRFIGKLKHCKSMMRDESFRFMRNELPSCSTDSQQPRFVSHRSEHNTSRVWHKNIACTCALMFWKSDLERSRMFYPWEAYFWRKTWSVETLDVSPDDFLRFHGFEKVVHAYKSKQPEEVPSKESALKSVKVMQYMESRQGLWQYIAYYRAVQVTVYRAWHIYPFKVLSTPL